ncbi:hypothetical protein [Jejuia pallidilutea]|nr:hypothetical protein [Jejuia pallidilutea]GAL73168.1 hypothetical protein JCM19302_3049 [Jejuia pallidilutea]
MVELLLRHNADTAIKDNEGKLALEYAKNKGFTDVVDLLK